MIFVISNIRSLPAEAIWEIDQNNQNLVFKSSTYILDIATFLNVIKENLQTFPLDTDKLGHLNTPTTYRSQKSQILMIIGTVQIGRSKSSFHSIPFFSQDHKILLLTE